MSFKIKQKKGYWQGEFHSMASHCEILIETNKKSLAHALTKIAYTEASRIEQKFSRYRSDNIIYKINNSHGKTINVDEETALLLDYADQCFHISNGYIDITSGVLREAWKFDGGDKIPSKAHIERILPRIGWQKTSWKNPQFTLPNHMEIDMGGIGKEYAVDRTAMLIRAQTEASVLINFGGDLFATKAKRDGSGWVVGVEQLNQHQKAKMSSKSTKEYLLKQGGIATSGDVYRYLLKDGVRYGHILNPHTGWPIMDAPHTATVVAESCIEAGILATLAMLNGRSAREFLSNQDVEYWLI